MTAPRRRALALLLAAVALATTVTGCAASIRSRADDAFERGDFSSAAALYANVVANDPSDGTAKARLGEARAHVLESMSLDVDRERASGASDPALDKLDRFLGTSHDWGTSGDEATTNRKAAQVAWAAGEVRASIARFVAARAPLSAEAYLAAHATLLRRAELAPTLAAVSPSVVASGREVCSSAAARIHPDTPYYARIAARLCRHFGGIVSLEPPLPYVVSSLTLAGHIDGASEEDRARVFAAVQRGLEASPFWDAAAGRVATVTLSGHNRAAYDKQSRTITRPWVEQVPYQALETYDEPYTEYYPETETYDEQVPYTDYETQSRPCGNTTCTESVPVTRYRSESRTRTVTRQRTAFRQRTRTVTRYRDEDRIFTFEALELSGAYDADLSATIDVKQDLPPFVVHFSAQETQRGLEHDTSFPPAGVTPSHTLLPTASAWLAGRTGALAGETGRTARDHWLRAFCARGAFALEEASRCAYGSPQSLPSAARAALADAVGPDVDLTLRLEK